jgi:hypothetical protein
MSQDLEREFPHGSRGLLRALVATIDREMSRTSEPAESEKNRPTPELRSSWAKLVELLALGPAPEVRECPVCRHIGMRAATRCGYCWTKLQPLSSAPRCEEEARTGV